MWASLIWAMFLLVVVIMFSKEIKGLFSSFARQGKVQYNGFSLQLGSDIPTLATNQQELADTKHIEMQKTYQSVVVNVEERTIKNQLIEANLTNEQAVNVLVYHLAHANLAIKLLSVDKLIFIEQINLLLFLNKQVKSCPESDLFVFYQEWKNGNTNVNYEFKSFLDFLSHHRLIFQSIDGYAIAPIGKEYLVFLVRIGSYRQMLCTRRNSLSGFSLIH